MIATWLLCYYLLGPIEVVTNNITKSTKDGSKIVGGVPSEISRIPYQVSLSRPGGRHFCGGSIISSNHVLTAAHCVQGLSPQLLFIRSGSSIVNQGGSQTPVREIRIHPRYNSEAIDNDLAVLRTSNSINGGQVVTEKKKKLVAYNYDLAILHLYCPFIFDNSTKAIRLAETEPPVNTWALASGWGTNSEKNKNPTRRLHSVWLRTVERRTCQTVYASYNRVTSNMLCAGFREGGRDACQGDSGGPLAARGVLIAVTSWGRGCGRRGYYGVFASIPANLQWIRSNMND